MLHSKGYTSNGKITKRIGANKQMRINARNQSIKEFFNSKAVVYSSYVVGGGLLAVGGYILMVMAILFDPSNPYN